MTADLVSDNGDALVLVENPAAIRQLVHVNLVVSDIERSGRFYTEQLGGRIVRDWHGSSRSGRALGFTEDVVRWHALMLRWGDGYEHTFPQVDLLEWEEPKSYGVPPDRMNHIGIPRIAFEVPDVVEMHSRLSAEGVEFLSAPIPTNPDTFRGSRTLVCCLRDPDGIVIELIGPLGRPRRQASR